MGKKNNINSCLDEALSNIRTDRSVTNSLLADVILYLKKSEENYKEVGSIAAKYVETLQRSNEQLVKIVSLMQKSSDSNAELTDKDKSEIFDLIQEMK
tara:strand:+ start:690 stop:983 length:294 start_codon:yes stop_codon:yes gene_type:complete